MDIPNYETKVPQNVRDENSQKLSTYQTEFDANNKSLAELQAFL